MSQQDQQVLNITSEVIEEVFKAMKKHSSMKSNHEGYAVILEELDELWDEIKKQHPNNELIRKEAIQVAAMAVRFILDRCSE